MLRSEREGGRERGRERERERERERDGGIKRAREREREREREGWREREFLNVYKTKHALYLSVIRVLFNHDEFYNRTGKLHKNHNILIKIYD